MIDDLSPPAWGAVGTALGVLGVVLTRLLSRKPKSLQLQEAANSAVQTALEGYKTYIATMTAAYEARIEAMAQDHEARIRSLSTTYEEKIAALTAEIHSLRSEITAWKVARSTAIAADPAAV